MKILLIGFSKQSAEVLQTLVARHYPKYTCAIVERHFNENLRLCLPSLAPEHGDAKAMVINMDGIGMMGYHSDYIKPLQAFIGIRSAVLVARGQTTLWQHARILPEGLLFCLKSPFDKETAIAYFDALIEAAPKARLRADEFETQQPSLFKEAPTKMQSKQAMPKINSEDKVQKPCRNPEDEFLHKLIDDYFTIPQNQLLHDLLDVGLAKNPLKLMAGSQILYINHEQNLALVNNMPRLIDYCAVAKKFETLSNIIGVQTISVDEFDDIANDIPNNGYQRFALNTLLWRMYSEILPEKIDIKDHQLVLKMRYMPNFANINDVPEYVRSLVSSCIVAPRSIEQLRLGLEGLGGNDVMVFNRVFLLAILSGAADIEILKQSLEGKFRKKETENLFGNTGVQNAKKTGFLSRLLSKLKIK